MRSNPVGRDDARGRSPVRFSCTVTVTLSCCELHLRACGPLSTISMSTGGVTVVGPHDARATLRQASPEKLGNS